MSTVDPEHLDDIDREIRINELKEQARELSGGEMEYMENPDIPPEISEQFWSHIVETERAGWTSARCQLLDSGVDLPPPEALSDAALSAKLDEIFAALAARRTFFINTNHLSDRQLYEDMLSDLLDERMPDLYETSPDGAYIIDLVGSGSEEDMQIFFRYYADEEDRESWQKEFPGDPMPPREDPPYDRDRRLPPPPDGL
jgi:hypothetical protein